MYGWVCVARCCHKLPSPVVRAPMLSCGQTAASWCTRVSPSHPGCPLQTRGHCSSASRGVALSGVILWCGWTNGWHAQFRANPVKPKVCLDVTAIVVLHTTPLPLFLGHPSVQDLVDKVDTVAMALVQLHREMLKVCTDMCNAPISRTTIRAPVEYCLGGW